MALIKTENLWKTYDMGTESVHALRAVSLEVERGEFLAIMGPSGSGKSTLMNLIGCLDTPTEGTYLINGRPVSGMNDDELARIRNREIGFVFQTFNLLPRASALHNVELPLIYAGIPAAERKEQAVAALHLVELDDRMDHRPNELSGGQRQRVAIARALVNNPSIVLADEPTGNLDSANGRRIVELLRDVNRRSGAAVLLVTHDPAVAAAAEQVLEMQDGRLLAARERPQAEPPDELTAIAKAERGRTPPIARVAPAAERPAS